MYQYVRAYLRSRKKNSRWTSVDISAMTLATLFRNYLDGYITLTNTSLSPNEMYLDLTTLRQFTAPFTNIAFSDWLHLTNMPVLPTIAQEPTYTTQHVLYSDAIQAAYELRPCLGNDYQSPPDYEFYINRDDDALPLSQKPDLAIHKPGSDTSLLHRRVLTSVNGFYHYSKPRASELQIVSGSISVLKRPTRTPDIGLTSFESIGDVTQYRILAEHIQHGNPETPTTPYLQRYGTYLNMGVDLRGKTIGVVLGGYLHINDNAYDVINPATGLIKINFSALNMAQRIFESRDWIDLSSLALVESKVRLGAVSTTALLTNTVLERYLTLPQSFVIAIDAPVVYRETTTVGRTALPFVFDSVVEPRFPLKSPYGRLMTYWTRHVGGLWLLDVDTTQGYDYLFETDNYNGLDVVNPTVITSERREMQCVLEGIYSMSPDTI